MLRSNSFGLLIIVMLLIAVTFLWLVRQPQQAVIEPSVQFSNKAEHPRDYIPLSVNHSEVTKVPKKEIVSSTMEAIKEELLLPGQLTQAEIDAEGLTPELLEAELNEGSEIPYPYQTEYILVPPGVQSIPGNPNAQ